MVAMVSLTLLLVSIVVSTTNGCVELECSPPSTTPQIYTFGDITHWLVIFAIVVGCIVALVLLVMLIWLACWCCYRCDNERAPDIVRRVVVLRRQQAKQQQLAPCPPPPCIVHKQKTFSLDIMQPPPPIMQHQPSEKIIVVQPAQVKPQSLLLTVSDSNCHNTSGPVMTTLLERPLTFTLTPEFSQHQTDLSHFEARSVGHDFTVPSGHYSACNECHRH